MKLNKYTKLFLAIIGLASYAGFAQEKHLSIEEAKTLAIQNNKKIQIANQNIEAAKAAKASVYASDKPFVDGSIMGLGVGKPLNVLLPEYSANASIGVTQVIYAGNKINTAKKMTTTAIEIQNLEKELTSDQILLETENTYWQLVNVNEKVELATKYQLLLKTLLNDLTNSYNAGIIYKNDVLQVQVELNKAELNLTKAKDGVVLLKLKLAQLIGMNNINFSVTKVVNSEANLLPIENTETILENRPEIVMLKNAVTLQELQTSLLKAERRPTIAFNINGLYATGKQINFSDGTNDFTTYYGLLNINVPIFDWGGRKQKVKEQEFKTEAQKIELEEISELVSLEVHGAYLKLKQSIESVEIAKRSLQQAEENLRLNEDRFKAGTVIGKDVLEAQVLWQNAYSNLIDAEVEYKIDLAKYQKSIGNLN